MRRQGNFPDNGFKAWGGYMNAKIAKLEEQFSHRTNKEENQVSHIFSGVSIYVNGYTIPSADELKTLMSIHGGIYHTYQRSNDYVIASNLPDTKVKNMSLSRIVRPEWITDSIASNRLLDYREYLLFRNPRGQSRLNFNKVDKNLIDESKIDCDINVKTSISAIPLEKDLDHLGDSDNQLVLLPDDIKQETIAEKSEISKPISLNTNQVHDFKKPDHGPKTAVDPSFISEFYNNSRLHHISQLGACFKQHVNELREKSEFVFPARNDLKQRILALNTSNNLSPINFEKGKTIMHIDMDCFFVSVGLRTRPNLRGKPVAVTHSKGGHPRPKRPGVDRDVEFSLYKQKQIKKLGKATGKPEDEIEFESRVDSIADEDDKFGSMSEIASCSYEARAKGVGNGMFMGAALKLCPDIQTIPYDFEGYKEVAYTLYNTLAQYTLDVEAVSCDEMYVDCTDLLKEIDASVQDFATVLRNEIKNKTGCPCSTGFGGNRLQARLATKRAKPDGQFFLTAELVEDFMFDIKLRDLPGVGRQTAQKLESIGHLTCGSLQSLTLVALKSHLGNKTGAQLFDQCRGRDTNPLTFHTIRKSVSAEVNYGIRFENNDQCIEFLKQLSVEVHSRMQQFKVLAKCITLKLMIRAEDAPVETAKFMGHGFCDVINKSVSLNNATNDIKVITAEIISLCKKQQIDPKDLRGIGIQMTKLESVNVKPIKGAINKFLTTKSVKKDDQNENVSNVPLVSVKNDVNIDIGTKNCTTPKKAKIKSPIAKSPVLVKSPIGKRRGRPPKTAKTVTSKNLISKFLQGETVIKDTPYKDPMIRQKVDEKPVIIVKPTIEQEPQGLLSLPWDKVRELLRAWLESEQAPLPCDTDMIASYMRELVIKRNIDKLNILLNFLRRRTRELNNADWRQVYYYVLEQIQNAMIAVYGKRLWVEDY